MTLQEFINQWSGKGCDWDHFYGFQCFDLAHQYANDVVGKDIPGAPAAKDLWDKTIDGYDKVANTPDGVPQPGDIVIWGVGVGAFGHVAVFVNGNADSFTSFDQNFPLGSLCHLQQHNYNGVLGWFHPKQVAQETVAVPKIDFENLVTKATAYDEFVANGYPHWSDVLKKLDEVQVVVDDLTQHSQATLADLVTSQRALGDAQAKIADLQKNQGYRYDEADIKWDKPLGLPWRVIELNA